MEGMCGIWQECRTLTEKCVFNESNHVTNFEVQFFFIFVFTI